MGTLTGWQLLAGQLSDGNEFEFSEEQEDTDNEFMGYNESVAIFKGVPKQGIGVHVDLRSPSFITPVPTASLSNLFGLNEAPSSFVTPKQLHLLYKEYRLLNEIGSGAFGRVCKAKRLKDGQEVVVKEIRTVHLSGKMKAATMDEVQVLARMNHPNIVRYHDCFMDGNYINIVMEYCSAGDIGKLVKARLAAKQILTEDEIMFVFVQICLALQYTHAAGVLHRDLKTSNCMLLNPSTMSSSPAAASGPSAYRGIGFPLVKLGDFGVAKVTGGEAGSMCNTVVGTPQYIPPEMLESKPYGRRSDVWALGCILYELCCLKRAFDSDKIPVIYHKITQGTYDPLPDSCSEQLKLLVQKLVCRDAKARPTVLEILHFPYVRQHLSAYLDWAKTVPEAHPEVLLQSLGEQWSKGTSNHVSTIMVTAAAAGTGHNSGSSSPVSSTSARQSTAGQAPTSRSPLYNQSTGTVQESTAGSKTRSTATVTLAGASPAESLKPPLAQAAATSLVNSGSPRQQLFAKADSVEQQGSVGSPTQSFSGKISSPRLQTLVEAGDCTSDNETSPQVAHDCKNRTSSPYPDSAGLQVLHVQPVLGKGNNRRCSLLIDADILAERLKGLGPTMARPHSKLAVMAPLLPLPQQQRQPQAPPSVSIRSSPATNTLLPAEEVVISMESAASSAPVSPRATCRPLADMSELHDGVVAFPVLTEHNLRLQDALMKQQATQHIRQAPPALQPPADVKRSKPFISIEVDARAGNTGAAFSQGIEYQPTQETNSPALMRLSSSSLRGWQRRSCSCKDLVLDRQRGQQSLAANDGRSVGKNSSSHGTVHSDGGGTTQRQNVTGTHESQPLPGAAAAMLLVNEHFGHGSGDPQQPTQSASPHNDCASPSSVLPYAISSSGDRHTQLSTPAAAGTSSAPSSTRNSHCGTSSSNTIAHASEALPSTDSRSVDALLLEQQEVLRKLKAYKAKLHRSLKGITSEAGSGGTSGPTRTNSIASICSAGSVSPGNQAALAHYRDRLGLLRGGSSSVQTRWGPQCI